MARNARRKGLTTAIGRVQAQAERALSRGYKATLELLPDGPRKAVKQVASQLEAQASGFGRRGQKALNGVEKQSEALRQRIERALKVVERRSGRALASVDAQRARLVTTLERRVADVVRPLAHGLDLATLSDIERLSRRVALLERKRAVKRAA